MAGDPSSDFVYSVSDLKEEPKEKSLSDKVKQLEVYYDNAKYDLETIRATLLVNFGEEGRLVKGIVKNYNGTFEMLIKVIRYYQEKLEKYGVNNG